MNMVCANKTCQAELKYLRGGRLFLMEREPNTPSSMTEGTSEPKRRVTMRRYFWLCENCAQVFLIRRWTEAGIELVSRHSSKFPSRPTQDSREWAVPGLVG